MQRGGKEVAGGFPSACFPDPRLTNEHPYRAATDIAAAAAAALPAKGIVVAAGGLPAIAAGETCGKFLGFSGKGARQFYQVGWRRQNVGLQSLSEDLHLSAVALDIHVGKYVLWGRYREMKFQWNDSLLNMII